MDIKKVQFKYLTGINKGLDGYPTPLDILFDCCQESVDGTFFTSAKLENRYGIDEKKVEQVLDELVELGYIQKKTKNYKIIRTPWD